MTDGSIPLNENRIALLSRLTSVNIGNKVEVEGIVLYYASNTAMISIKQISLDINISRFPLNLDNLAPYKWKLF